MNKLYEKINNLEFEVKTFCGDSSRTFITVMDRQSEIAEITEGINRGEIGLRDVQNLVDRVIKQDFKRGVRFSHDHALAALAVAISRSDKVDLLFDDYLVDLSKVNIAEMQKAPSVARELVQVRLSQRPEPVIVESMPASESSLARFCLGMVGLLAILSAVTFTVHWVLKELFKYMN